MPIIPTLAPLPSFSEPSTVAAGGVPFDKLTEAEKALAWFTVVLYEMQLHQYRPFLGHP